MRNLTIKRGKAFAASMAKSKVYIEDPASQELVIDGIPCRKLGELKNGEEKTFQIGNQQARIFVIAGKASTKYCKDMYPLPAGDEDVFLTGKHYFNPASGNAFRFDGLDDPETAKKRKKGSIIGVVILVCAILIGAIAGRLIGRGVANATLSASKTFTNADFSITLTKQFQETDIEGFKYCYNTGDCVVYMLEEPFNTLSDGEDLSVEEYGRLVLQANNQNPNNLQTSNGQVWFTYEATDYEANATYSYYVTAHKSADAFWLVQFACEKDDFDSMRSDFENWAKTVEFK